MANLLWCSFTKQQLCGGKRPEELKYETQCRRSAADLLQKSGISLGLPQLTIATALVYFQRFFVRHSYRDYDKDIVAITCLFLAGKVEETPKKLSEILDKTAEVRKQKLTEEKKAQLREKILYHEFVLLSTINFDLKVDHPYKYILTYVKALQAPTNVAQCAWNFVNDSFRSTTLCLQFRPQQIASSAIMLAAKFCRYPLPEDNKPWWKYLDDNITKENLEEIGNQILDLYENSPMMEAMKSATLPTPDKSKSQKEGVSHNKQSSSQGKPSSVKPSSTSSQHPQGKADDPKKSQQPSSHSHKRSESAPRSPKRRSHSPQHHSSPKRQRHSSPHQRSPHSRHHHHSSKSHHHSSHSHSHQHTPNTSSSSSSSPRHHQSTHAHHHHRQRSPSRSPQHRSHESHKGSHDDSSEHHSPRSHTKNSQTHPSSSHSPKRENAHTTSSTNHNSSSTQQKPHENQEPKGSEAEVQSSNSSQ